MTSKRPHNKVVIGILSLMGVALLFIGSAYASNKYATELQSLIRDDGALGMVMYVLVTATAVVVAPVSTLPLIPLAVNIWGWVTTAALSIVGWVIGSQISFIIARRYGKALIQKFVSLKRLEEFENRFSERDIFWTLVLLRMTVPVDVLSYALGLFSRVSGRVVFLTTLLGVTPFAFVFSYVGRLSVVSQITSFLVVLLLTVSVHYVGKYNAK